ncbi:hypothetical protein SDC9_185793 [bioreactor metagenome]|uniref:Uncharacterized protein n=1 Tax=bioreactor metagenome TaxID=1076179 RepID=A0A645HJ98_9ZZZZ
MHHGDAGKAQRVQMLHGLLGFRLVAGAHVEHQRVDRLMKHHCPSGRRHQCDPVFGQMRQDGLSVRRGTAHEQGHHVVLFDQAQRVLARQLGIELVVQRDQLDLLAVHAALGVDAIQVQIHTNQRFPHAGSHRPGDCRGLPYQYVGPGRRGVQRRRHQKRSQDTRVPAGQKNLHVDSFVIQTI